MLKDLNKLLHLFKKYTKKQLSSCLYDENILISKTTCKLAITIMLIACNISIFLKEVKSDKKINNNNHNILVNVNYTPCKFNDLPNMDTNIHFLIILIFIQ